MFKREDRYIVLKRTDAEEYLDKKYLEHLENTITTINYFRGLKGPLECVVVEKDWPEYEIVWKMIEDRVNASS